MEWSQLESEVKQLSEQIRVYNPEVIIAITRGGLVPARLISTYLKVNDLYCLTVEKDGPNRRVVTTIEKDLANKRVLLVEDMLETGVSLIAAKEYLKFTKRAEVRTTCLYVVCGCSIVPNFYLRVVREVQKFPWE